MANSQVQEVEASVIAGPGYRDIAITKGGGRFSISLLVKGILLILAGITCHFWPLLSLEVLSWSIGLSFMITGIGSVVAFFISGGFKVYSGWVLLESIVDVFMGCVFIAHPFASAAAMGWLAGVGILMAGFAISLGGVSAFKVNRTSSILLLIAGILTCLLGIVITMHPGISLVKCISIFSVLYGVLLIVLAFKAPKVVDAIAEASKAIAR